MPKSTTFLLLADNVQFDAEQMLRAALSQCVTVPPQVALVNVHSTQEIAHAFQRARRDHSMVALALLDTYLRQTAHFYGRHANVPLVDLIEPVTLRLADMLEMKPEDNPVLSRHLDESYFRRIEAIEFAVAHDDGLRSQDLHLAEIVLTGVSRTSKTPLSMYLASHGWLVANVPLVADIEPPPQLFEVDPNRVFALTIRPERLAMLRMVRLTRLGMSAPVNYADTEYIERDLQHARGVIMRGKGWTVVDATSKSIEETASEVVQSLGTHTEI
ncbi:MAG: pyruvate, water dikinase regulatory protein [Anaerolineae bacterium]